jgi:hypothetical protein
MAMLHSLVYIENKVEWIDDLLVFRQKSIVDGFAKFGILSGLGLMLLSLFLKSSIVLEIGFIGTLISMACISPLVRFLAISLKLFIMGHRNKMELVNNNLLIEKLFFKLEVENAKDEGEVKLEVFKRKKII